MVRASPIPFCCPMSRETLSVCADCVVLPLMETVWYGSWRDFGFDGCFGFLECFSFLLLCKLVENEGMDNECEKLCKLEYYFEALVLFVERSSGQAIMVLLTDWLK